CFGSKVTAFIYRKRVLQGLAMVLELSDAVLRVFHGSEDGTACGVNNDGRQRIHFPRNKGLPRWGCAYRSSSAPCYSSSNAGRRQWKKLSTKRARAAMARAEVMEFSIAVNAMERAGYPRRSSLSPRPLPAWPKRP